MKEGEIFGEVAYITKGDGRLRPDGRDTVVGTSTELFRSGIHKLSDNFRMVLSTMATPPAGRHRQPG
jgi:hypothetical protein